MRRRSNLWFQAFVIASIAVAIGIPLSVLTDYSKEQKANSCRFFFAEGTEVMTVTGSEGTVIEVFYATIYSDDVSVGCRYVISDGEYAITLRLSDITRNDL